MKKIEMLHWIEDTFGSEYVLPYFLCHTWQDIESAINWFEKENKEWAIRSDSSEGTKQLDNSPHIFKASKERAFEVWKQYGQQLYYIVNGIQPENIVCQATAIRADEENILIEFNDTNSEYTIRDITQHPLTMKRIGVGPNNLITLRGFPNILIRSFRPENVSQWSFDKAYHLMIKNNIHQLDFTVKTDGNLIIWGGSLEK